MIIATNSPKVILMVTNIVYIIIAYCGVHKTNVERNAESLFKETKITFFVCKDIIYIKDCRASH